jgi:FMN phosphatase YigB (HAD superfamily)
MHYAADLGAFKTQLRFYCLVGSRTGLTPAEHCLIDDSSDNLVVAKRAGWQTFLWTSRSCIGDVLLSVNR